MMDCWQSPWRLAGIGTVELNKPPYNTNLAYDGTVDNLLEGLLELGQLN